MAIKKHKEKIDKAIFRCNYMYKTLFYFKINCTDGQ